MGKGGRGDIVCLLDALSRSEAEDFVCLLRAKARAKRKASGVMGGCVPDLLMRSLACRLGCKNPNPTIPDVFLTAKVVAVAAAPAPCGAILYTKANRSRTVKL